MKRFKTIFTFEYTNYIKTKSYIAITAVLLVIIAVVASLPAINGLFSSIGSAVSSLTGENDASPQADEDDVNGQPGSESNLTKALLADKAGIYTDELLALYLPQYSWERVPDLSGAVEGIENGTYGLALMIDGVQYTGYEKSASIINMGNTSALVEYMIKDITQKTFLMERGLSYDEAEGVINVLPVGSVDIVGKDYTQSFWLSYCVLFLMYMVVMLYGQFVSTSVITEKSSKAMELLVTSAKPFQLMFGKVLGVGAAGLTQFGLVLLTALGLFKLNHSGWTEFSPMVASLLDMSVSGNLVMFALLFFILGFFSFAFVYAGFASTVSRMEEANSVVMMPTFLFMAAFIVAMFGGMNPEAGFVRICSFVPFLSPLVMFMRICVTDPPAIEVLISIAINIGTVFGAALICSRIYRVGVMLYGKKPNIKDIMRYAFGSRS